MDRWTDKKKTEAWRSHKENQRKNENGHGLDDARMEYGILQGFRREVDDVHTCLAGVTESDDGFQPHPPAEFFKRNCTTVVC